MALFSKKRNYSVWIFALIITGLWLNCTKDNPIPPQDKPSGFTAIATSTTKQIQDFLVNGSGTGNGKLVFIKKLIPSSTNTAPYYTFWYADFSESSTNPTFHNLPALDGAQVPVISPDGKWVVYAKGAMMVEAGATSAAKSSTYICRLAENATPVLLVADSAFEPRFMQNSKSDTLNVIFPTKANDFAWKGIGKTMKIKVDVSSGTPVAGKPEVLFSTAGFTGGLSADNKYLCGGGGNVGMVDLTSGKTKGDTACTFSQACNASISSSTIFTNSLMYLTVDASDPKVNGGKPWSTWQIILINDNSKNILKWYLCPDSSTLLPKVETVPPSYTKTKWHHCEWSNHPYFAVTTLNVDRYFMANSGVCNTAYQERIFLINLKSKEYLPVVHPDSIKYRNIDLDNSGYYWPWLWVEKPANFTEDTQWLKP